MRSARDIHNEGVRRRIHLLMKVLFPTERLFNIVDEPNQGPRITAWKERILVKVDDWRGAHRFPTRGGYMSKLDLLQRELERIANARGVDISSIVKGTNTTIGGELPKKRTKGLLTRQPPRRKPKKAAAASAPTSGPVWRCSDCGAEWFDARKVPEEYQCTCGGLVKKWPV